LDKKKKIKLDEDVAGCQDKLDTLDTRIETVAAHLARVECQELPGMKATDRGTWAALELVRSAVASMEKRVLDLEQAHCDHDYEIAEGKVSRANRIHRTYLGMPVMTPPSVLLKCTKCGKIESRALTPAVEPEPKLTTWRRFKNWLDTLGDYDEKK
jgi:hypothetical protein